MTRDEIKSTPEIVDCFLDESVRADSREKLHKRIYGICNLAIKALEQESVLNEIRAEIKQLPYQRIFKSVSSYSLLDVVVEIIDKYREGGSGN